MANINGAVNLKLGETTYVLVPKWKAIEALENGTADSITTIMAKIGQVHATTIITVLLEAMKCSGYTEFTRDTLGELVTKDGGFKVARKAAADWIAAFVVAPDDVKNSEGEVKAGEAKPVE